MRSFFTITSFLFASITLNAFANSVALPEKIILDAARQIQPQTGTYYFVHGFLSCAQIMREYEPPFFKNPYKFEVSACEMTINNKTVLLDNNEDVITALKTLKSRVEKEDWTISVKFTAHSVSRDFPPYTVTESAVAEEY